MRYKNTPLKSKEARHCGHSDGTSDLSAAFVPHEGCTTLLRIRIQRNRLNGEPTLITFRYPLVEGLLCGLHDGFGVEPGGSVVRTCKADLRILDGRVRAGRLSERRAISKAERVPHVLGRHARGLAFIWAPCG